MIAAAMFGDGRSDLLSGHRGDDLIVTTFLRHGLHCRQMETTVLDFLSSATEKPLPLSVLDRPLPKEWVPPSQVA